MSKYDFCDELMNKMGMKELDSDTLYYPLNLFLDATSMNIKRGGYDDVFTIDNLNYMYASKSYQSEKTNYSFEIMRSINTPKNNYFIFRGKYNDLLFNLHLYYKKTMDNNQQTLPYSICLSKGEGDQYYNIIINVLNSGKTKFCLERNPQSEDEMADSIVFYSNRVDLENVFGVIKTFIHSPEALYLKYKEIMNNKEIYFNSQEINSLESDDILVTKQGKMLKKVINTRK